MGVNDGNIIGVTKILDNGPDAQRLNIVLVAEGFTSTQQTTFNNLCTDFVNKLQAENWYPIFGNAINVHRLNVASDDSGTDDPVNCDDGSIGSGTSVNTYFDSKFCNSGIRRCLSGDYDLLQDTLDNEFPNWYVGGVLVNTTDHGGCAKSWLRLFWTSIKPGWENIALHELGHAAFDLADEYPTWEGCSSGETDRNNAPAGEPSEANVTTVTNRADLKWRHLITPGVPIPTMTNPDCSQCDLRANVLSDDDAVGLFEGAKYYHCGRYRPAYRCRMRNNTEDFCRVCIEQIARILNEFIPATPTLDVVPTALNFGKVAHGLTMYRGFEVKNIKSGRPGELYVTLAAPTGEFTYAPGTETSFTLPAPIFESYTSKNIYVAFTSSSTGSPNPTGQAQVSTVGLPTNTTITVNLSAEPVPPVPVDSVLVIDRSGSMNQPSGIHNQKKVDLAIESANLYVSLLKNNDKIGVVRYNNVSGPSDVLLNLTLAGDPSTGSGRQVARSVLNTTNLNPALSTSIGAGIINASTVLDAGTADSRALVVLTDGRQNTSPDIPTATAVVSTKTPKQRVFAVGLGLNQLEDKLNQIALVTNGTAHITGDLVDEREFILQKLYVQILSDVNDEAFVHDPIMVAQPGQRQSTTIYLGEVDVSADFIIVHRRSSRFPKYMKIELESPDGRIFTQSDIAALPNAEFVQHETHSYIRWQFSMFPDQPLRHSGPWKVWVENMVRGEYFYEGILTYSVMAKARSDFLLGGRLVQTDYKPGSNMRVILEPTMFGVPIELDPPVKVKVVRPDGVQRTLTLKKDEYGAYIVFFNDTGLVGRYIFSAEVSTKSPMGNRMTRIKQMTGLIFIPGIAEDGYISDDQLCKRAKGALRLLERLVDKCCKSAKMEQSQLSQTSTRVLLAEISRRLDESQLKRNSP